MTTAHEMLSDARSLLDGESTEARRRTIMSRCYYAAYHAWLPLSEEVGYAPDGGMAMGMHRQFLTFLIRQSRDPLLKRVGIRLRDVYDGRITADYRLDVPVIAKTATITLDQTAELIEDWLPARP